LPLRPHWSNSRSDIRKETIATAPANGRDAPRAFPPLAARNGHRYESGPCGGWLTTGNFEAGTKALLILRTTRDAPALGTRSCLTNSDELAPQVPHVVRRRVLSSFLTTSPGNRGSLAPSLLDSVASLVRLLLRSLSPGREGGTARADAGSRSRPAGPPR
jgi:hypothetical protein